MSGATNASRPALLTPEQCEFAYRNARAEFEQKAPRYASRASVRAQP
jgi:uncharacterized protein YgiB involved in biofilm formation